MSMPVQNHKRVLPVYTTSVTNGATAAGYVDCLGFDYLGVSVYMTTADVVSNKPATLRILETDATQPTSSTNYATISGFVSGTDYTIPSAVTSQAATTEYNPVAFFGVDLKARKRYIRVEVSPVTTQIITAVAELGRAEQTPSTSKVANVVVLG